MTMRGMLQGLGVVGLCLLAGCGQWGWTNQRAQADFHQTTDVSGVTLAIIETQNGSVDADCAATGSQATIDGQKYADAASMETAQQRLEKIQITVARDTAQPATLHIKAEFPHISDGSVGANFRLSLPPDLAVIVRTSNGPATVKAARGNVEIHTSNGWIHAQALGADLLARTANGGITGKNIAGDVDAVSANGSIILENVGRDRVIARTSNSGIHVTESHGDLKLISSNGPIDLKTHSLPAVPHVEVRTANGSAHVELPRSVKAALHLTTSNAGIHRELVGAEVTQAKGDHGNFTAALNGGGGQIEVSSSNGPVRFGLIEAKPVEAKPVAAEKSTEAEKPAERH
jgi:hypothetical protein